MNGIFTIAPLTTELRVNDINMIFQIDTGSPIAEISEKDFREGEYFSQLK